MEADYESADYACICCSGAYESFEEITKMMEKEKEVKEKEKLMDAKLSEKYGNAEKYQGLLLHRDKMVEKEKEVKEKEKLPSCELLKSGSATCQCKECCHPPCHSPTSDGSVHSEDCLDLLTTTDV